MIKQLSIILLGLLFPIQTLFAQQHSCSSPIPFDNCKIDTTIKLLNDGASGDVLISNVPNYHWYRGCGPTALGNVIGYYDGIGFSDLVEGDASTQTTEANNAIASSGHYDDYSLPDDTYTDTILWDKSHYDGAHTSNCIADFMQTSWSIKRLRYGWSFNSYIPISFNSYIDYINNNYHHTTNRYTYSDNVAWNIYKNEIDNNRPVVLLVDSNGDEITDHFVTGIGYNDIDKTYAVFDTWYTPVRWKEWHAISSVSWGINDFSTFLLQFTITANANNSNYGSVSGDGYFEAEESVTLTATPETGYAFINWTENSTEVSSSSTYEFTAEANRQLVANFEVDNTPPETLNINDIVFNSTTDNCFDATQNIIVANDGNPVEFAKGASATFIAGESISFLPGFHAESGSSVSAYISPEGAYCYQLPENLAQYNTVIKSSEINQDEEIAEQNDVLTSVKIYPNPNQGFFKVQLEGYTNAVEVSVINMLGAVVYNTHPQQSNLFEIDLSDKTRGIYLVRISDGDNLTTKKIIIQ